jgi:hypothetical protein
MLAVIDVIVKATVLLVAGFGLQRLTRRASAASRHAVWVAIFVALIVLPAMRVAGPAWRVHVLPALDVPAGASSAPDGRWMPPMTHGEIVTPAEGRTTAGPTAPTVGGHAQFVAWPTTDRAASWIVLVWILGATMILWRNIVGVLRARSAIRAAAPVHDVRLLSCFRRAAMQVGIRHPVSPSALTIRCRSRGGSVVPLSSCRRLPLCGLTEIPSG